MQNVIDDVTASVNAKSLAVSMQKKLVKKLGSGIDGTVHREYLTEGKGRRLKGIMLFIQFASILDPRTKHGCGFGENDLIDIHSALREKAIEVARRTKVYDNAISTAASSSSQTGEYDDFFNHTVTRTSTSTSQDSMEKSVDAELALYKIEPHISHKYQAESSFVYNNPLDWWKVNSCRFKVLLQMTKEILCIPATSAPVERLFSAVGNTITEERCNLSPDLANDMIFLHDVWPLLESKSKSV